MTVIESECTAGYSRCRPSLPCWVIKTSYLKVCARSFGVKHFTDKIELVELRVFREMSSRFSEPDWLTTFQVVWYCSVNSLQKLPPP